MKNKMNQIVLKAMHDYLMTNGIEAVIEEIGTRDTFIYNNIDFGEWYHLIFPTKKAQGIYPNNIGCYSFVSWVVWDLWYGRIEGFDRIG